MVCGAAGQIVRAQLLLTNASICWRSLFAQYSLCTALREIKPCSLNPQGFSDH